MTKITLLGDSIRLIGYGTMVPELLGEEYEVFQPDENCRYSKYTLRGLYDWRKGMEGSRIVHWNNGLWDGCNLLGDGPFTPVDEYVTNMLRIADRMLEKHDKVIFATTTPVAYKNGFNNNPDIERYNNILVPQLEAKGIIINDLYSLVSQDIGRYIRSDDCVHLSDEGIKVCAMQVADLIRQVAATLDDPKQDSVSVEDDRLGLPV